MKTAEEVAEEIVGPNIDGNKYHDAKIKLVAQALTAYADERVKEALLKHCDCESWSAYKLIDQARAEALEEAATTLEERLYAGDDPDEEAQRWNAKIKIIASDIRALKGKA